MGFGVARTTVLTFHHKPQSLTPSCCPVGGLYGVDAGGFFGGESMFHHEDNASKLAILFLAQHLTARGQLWMDIQQLTPHMQRLGARELTRPTFLTRLATELATARTLFAGN
ncbi:MAG: hypothetical protein NTV51_25510 [Verrucomicrobia bacterium]|nr:hypothetical protein [Verrucomicrobiota bacterium]